MTTRLAFSVLLANLVLVFGAGILFLLGVTFGPIWWGLYAGGAVLGASIFGKDRARNERSPLGGIVLALLLHAVLLLAACGLASRFLDVGWDSLETHQRAVHLIREGWNIVEPQSGWLNAQPEIGMLRRDPSVFTAYLDFNAMYVVSSLMGDLPFGVEGAKGYRILLLFMAGAITADLLRKAGLGKWAAFSAGLFVAANPLCLYQLWVLFMDFDVAVYSSLAIVGLYALSWKADRKAIFVTMVAVLLLLVSKRSGLAFAIPLGGLLCLWGVLRVYAGWRERPRKDSTPVLGFAEKSILRSWKFRAAGGMVGMIVLLTVLYFLGVAGRNVTTREGGYYTLGFVYRAIFEPDAFDRSFDVRVPESHQGLSRPAQFGRSLFEETGIYRGNQIKVPLTWTPGEWDTFRNIHWPGHGSGGFGPLFSAVLVFSALAWGLSWFPFPPVLNTGAVFRGILILTLVAICFVVPSWWARWVPFIWIFPLLFLLVPLFYRDGGSSQSKLLLIGRKYGLSSLCASIALFLAFFNSALLFGISTGETLRVTTAINDALEPLEGRKVVLDPGRSLMTKRWLIERGIDYRLSDEKGDLIFEMEPTTARLYQISVSP
jgi:hypothetical protein